MWRRGLRWWLPHARALSGAPITCSAPAEWPAAASVWSPTCDADFDWCSLSNWWRCGDVEEQNERASDWLCRLASILHCCDSVILSAAARTRDVGQLTTNCQSIWTFYLYAVCLCASQLMFVILRVSSKTAAECWLLLSSSMILAAMPCAVRSGVVEAAAADWLRQRHRRPRPSLSHLPSSLQWALRQPWRSAVCFSRCRQRKGAHQQNDDAPKSSTEEIVCIGVSS